MLSNAPPYTRFGILSNECSQPTLARSMNIHYQLATLNKGDSSIADYFHKFTQLTDTLAVVDEPLPPHEALSFLLVGLDSEYIL